LPEGLLLGVAHELRMLPREEAFVGTRPDQPFADFAVEVEVSEVGGRPRHVLGRRFALHARPGPGGLSIQCKDRDGDAGSVSRDGQHEGGSEEPPQRSVAGAHVGLWTDGIFLLLRSVGNSWHLSRSP
jgi:hypothetical protein